MGHVSFHRLLPPPLTLAQPRADTLAGYPPRAAAIRTQAARQRARPPTSAATEIPSENRKAPRSPRTLRTPHDVTCFPGARWNRHENDRGVSIQVPDDRPAARRFARARTDLRGAAHPLPPPEAAAICRSRATALLSAVAPHQRRGRKRFGLSLLRRRPHLHDVLDQLTARWEKSTESIKEKGTQPRNKKPP